MQRDYFAFTWPFTQLSQGYWHSPALVHHTLAQELAEIVHEGGTKVYQYIGVILVGGSDATTEG